MELKMIARIHTDFSTKFGIPRQSEVVKCLESRVVFEAEYRDPEALRGIEGFSHLWLVWGFSEVRQKNWSPTVRPPRLGGNERMGVFATRSPYRPNPVGLSCVRLVRVEPESPEGPVLHLLGADLMDGTPIYDIKPYVPYADCRPEAVGGFAADAPEAKLAVELEERWAAVLPKGKADALREVLAYDPRPRYQNDPERVYGMAFAGCEVKFRVVEDVAIVESVERES